MNVPAGLARGAPAVRLAVVASLGLAACGDGETAAGAAQAARESTAAAAIRTCDVVAAGSPLPAEVRETSGLARSARDPNLLWTHNDAGNEPLLFAIGQDGRVVQRVRVTGADAVDWEDVEAAPCVEGTCLFIGDIGDNDGDRDYITIYRVPEPPADAVATPAATALHARYPGGPKDAEGLFVDGSGRLHVVTKGTGEDIELYRYPEAQRAGEVATLELVRRLFPRPRSRNDRATAATATPDGRWVSIRTYATLYVYPAADLLGGGAVEPIVFDLKPLGEAQGESLAMANDGNAWTSSEAERGRGEPRLWQLSCDLAGAGGARMWGTTFRTIRAHVRRAVT